MFDPHNSNWHYVFEIDGSELYLYNKPLPVVDSPDGRSFTVGWKDGDLHMGHNVTGVGIVCNGYCAKLPHNIDSLRLDATLWRN